MGGGYVEVAHGTSHVQAVGWDGGHCPAARTLLTYSPPSNPDSPHHSDRTRLCAGGRWVTSRFREEDILRSPALRVVAVRDRTGGDGGGRRRRAGCVTGRIRGTRRGRGTHRTTSKGSEVTDMAGGKKAKSMAKTAKGKAKETTGKALGNESMEMEGKAEKMTGKAQRAGQKAKDTLKP